MCFCTFEQSNIWVNFFLHHPKKSVDEAETARQRVEMSC